MDNIRIVRLLVIEGPRSWVEGTMERSWVAPDRPYKSGGQSVREVLRVQEVVTPPAVVTLDESAA